MITNTAENNEGKLDKIGLLAQRTLDLLVNTVDNGILAKPSNAEEITEQSELVKAVIGNKFRKKFNM